MVRTISRLLGLSFISQLIPLITILYLSKKVSVAEIGYFSFFYSCSSIFSIFFSLKLENSLTQIKRVSRQVLMLQGITFFSILALLFFYFILYVVSSLFCAFLETHLHSTSTCVCMQNESTTTGIRPCTLY